MEYRDYQLEIINEGTDILNKFNIIYLAMEVRTGKTITALGICQNIEHKNVLFITKKKAIQSILDDSKHFNDLNVTCINFESVHKIQGFFDIIIIDEAHSLGTFPKPSLRTKNIKLMTKNKKIIYLSGTPTPESYSQIFHQLWVSDFSPFNAFKNFYAWAKKFVNIEKKYLYNREINDYSNAKEVEIKQLINHLFITKTQESAGFNVKIIEKILYVEPDSVTTKTANLLIKNRLIQGKQSVIIADTAVKLQQKLHQIYSGSVKDEDGKIIILSKNKAEFLKEYFKDKKIAIFYKFIGEFNILKEVFEGLYTTIPTDFQDTDKQVYSFST